MNLSIDGKYAVICGSTQGIGYAIAKALAQLGANCILLSRNEISLQKAVASLYNNGNQQHQFAIANFENNELVQAAINTIVAKQPIEILINNTGGPAPGAIIDALPQNFTKAFEQHIINNQILVQAVLPAMKLANYGRIINIVSTSVKIPIANLGVSNTIRAATASWAKTLSIELGQFGITVNNILPGYTQTQRLDSLLTINAEKQGINKEVLTTKMLLQIPARRFGEAEEVANLAAFLATPAAAYINGTSIPVDGGSTGAI